MNWETWQKAEMSIDAEAQEMEQKKVHISDDMKSVD